MEGEPEKAGNAVSQSTVVCPGLTHTLTGVLNRRNARLHRPRNLHAEGLRQRVRLVVAWCHHVRVPGRLPAILLRIDARDVPEDSAMAALPGVPGRRPPQS